MCADRNAGGTHCSALGAVFGGNGDLHARFSPIGIHLTCFYRLDDGAVHSYSPIKMILRSSADTPFVAATPH